jgi:DnaJ-class molecular chaperone
MKDYYKLLNISKSANEIELKNAYRKAALYWHPDKNKSSNASEKFIEINEAYNILINKAKRDVYDDLLAVHKEINDTRQNTNYDNYTKYNKWVKEERIKTEKELHISSDNIFTNVFDYLNRYGIYTLFGFLLIVYIIIMIVKK